MSADQKVVSFRPKGLTKQEMKKSAILQKIGASFNRIHHEAIAMPTRPSNEGRLFYGAFDLPIYHLADGRIHHVAGEHIDLMRSSRRFTHNAIELRCDALGLAIYLSSIANIDDERIKSQGHPVARAVRFVAYTFKASTHTKADAINEPSELYAVLHSTLLEAYNFAAAHYNMAGITDNCLVLRSSHEDLFPSIPLGLSDMENRT